MRENINKVSQRGERLDSLQDKTDNLAVSAQGFRRGANRVRKQMWWKDMKMRICLIVGIIILLLVIIVPAGEYFEIRSQNREADEVVQLLLRNITEPMGLNSSSGDLLGTASVHCRRWFRAASWVVDNEQIRLRRARLHMHSMITERQPRIRIPSWNMSATGLLSSTTLRCGRLFEGYSGTRVISNHGPFILTTLCP